jgi:hypothetical protein
MSDSALNAASLRMYQDESGRISNSATMRKHIFQRMSQ